MGSLAVRSLLLMYLALIHLINKNKKIIEKLFLLLLYANKTAKGALKLQGKALNIPIAP